ncbi:MAG: hypothetical protein AcusKO_28200 [Acuticoccus sp.]
MAKQSRHVVPHGSRWGVRKAGASRVSGTFETQQAAIDKAREVAQREGVELYVHGRDGRIRERNSYGKDPFPPKGLIIEPGRVRQLSLHQLPL